MVRIIQKNDDTWFIHDNGIEYSKNGLYIKPTANMNTVFENEKLNVDLINYNIAMFKQINNL